MIDTGQIQDALDISAGKVKEYADAARDAQSLSVVLTAVKELIDGQQALNDYLTLQNLNVVP